jgi:nucleotide-binding universal stress UspA family protein
MLNCLLTPDIPDAAARVAPPSNEKAGAPLVRARCGQRCFPGFPARLRHVLALSDLTPASRPALEFALEVAERFQTHLTLLHGGQTAPGEEEGERARLLCLSWDAKRRHPDASVCLALNRRPEQVWATAVARQADLIVVPPPVLRRFGPLVTREAGRERLRGAPCPVVVVDGALSPEGAGA